MRVLVIRFSSIGDLVLTSPVLRCLKAQFPDAELHFATKKAFADILRPNPHINQLHLLGENWKEFVANMPDFNWVFDLHHNLRSKRLINAIKAGQVFSYNKQNLNKWLLVNFKINRLEGYSVVKSYFNSLPINYDGSGLDFYLPADENFAKLKQQLPAKYVAVVLGGKFETKQMPADLLVELVAKISKPVVLLGGSDEKAKAEAVAATCAHCTNLAGILSLHESAFAVQQAQFVLSSDTGLMHVAAAFGKKMAVVWGNTVREFGFSPLYKEGQNHLVRHFEVEELSCRPCSKLGHASCPKGHFNCMRLQDTEAIARWVNGSIEANEAAMKE
ncbi:glycosyl transferase [bacterium]|nr:glycosyl transferase [bacterium]